MTWMLLPGFNLEGGAYQNSPICRCLLAPKNVQQAARNILQWMYEFYVVTFQSETAMYFCSQHCNSNANPWSHFATILESASLLLVFKTVWKSARDWKIRRACLHGAGGPQVAEVTRLSIQSLILMWSQTRLHVRWGNPPHVTGVPQLHVHRPYITWHLGGGGGYWYKEPRKQRCTVSITFFVVMFSARYHLTR